MLDNYHQDLPLSSLKVIELATVVAAPTTSEMLCAYGAEVIKVEALRGDEMRRSGATERTPYTDEVNPLYTVHNSGKKLIALNIKTPVGKQIFLELLADADVFVSNVREQSLRKLGLDYEALHETFPRLIYAHFSGFGPKGPEANTPGFDSTAFWLRNGAMADWQEQGAYPFRPTYAFGDMATSSVLLSGILMALLARNNTGRGCKVETSLMASGIWCNAVGVVSTQFANRRLNPDPLRPRNPFAACYQCADGRWIGMYINEYLREKEKFAKMLGMEDIIDDPRYATLDTLAETDTICEAVQRVSDIFRQKTSEEWRAFLLENNVSCEIMRNIEEVSRDPQAWANHYLEQVSFSKDCAPVLPCPPLHFSEYGRRPYQPTGRIGQHTEEVLQELGYSPEQIADFKHTESVK